jgi:sporulation protein YlmC with PRC-barrel domain
MNRLFLMPSPNELFSHPLRWIGKHLVFYALASLLAGVLFVAAAALYLRFEGGPIANSPAEKIRPGLPILLPSDPGNTRSAVVASAPPDISIRAAIGAKVVDSKNVHIGEVKDVTLSTAGRTTATIVTSKGASVKVPVDAFSWSNAEGKNVEAVVKPTVNVKTLFGG